MMGARIYLKRSNRPHPNCHSYGNHPNPFCYNFPFAFTGVGWIHLRVLSLVQLLRVPAFIASIITPTACRIWLPLLLARSCLNVSAVETR